MAEAVTHGVQRDHDTLWRALLDRIPHRTSIWMGLLLMVSGSIAPAAFIAQPGRVALLKLGIATAFTLLPGWLYVIYLDRRGESLYDEFVLNLFRLGIDMPANLPMPPRHTTFFRKWQEAHEELWRVGSQAERRTTDNLYRRRFEGVFGQRAVSTRAAFDGSTAVSHVETFSPVLLATCIIGLGWALTLQPELVVDVGLFSAVQLSGRPAVPVPALQFAFAGAYAFIVQDLVRRYFVVDLRNTAYVSAISRIVLTSLIVAVLYVDQQWLTPTQLVAAFGLGFFPRAALEALNARFVRPVARALQGRRHERLLGELDGMDIWQETRLVELGIENLPQFATADLVEILLRSRTPTDRLVAWLDRALLLLLLPGEREARNEAARRLLNQGVRYATDLEAAETSGSPRSRAGLAKALGMSTAGLSVAVGSLRRQRNYLHVAYFRKACETDGVA